MKLKNYADYIVISVILLFHAILNIWYIFKDTLPPAWDQAVHLLLSSAYFRGFDIQSTSDFYPPFYHLSVSPLYFLFGESFNTACLTNIIFLAILVFSIYGIGKILFNREVGLISAIIISFIPMLIGLQRDFLLDFALVSIVSLTIYLLLKADNFNNIKYSLLFGASFGFALLIKWTAGFYIFAPLCWVIWQAAKEKKKCSYCGKLAEKIYCTYDCGKQNKWKPIIHNFHHFCSERHKKKFVDEKKFILLKEHNFILSFIVFAVISAYWYLPNISVFSKLMSGSQYWGSVEGDPTGLMGFWYYIKIVDTQCIQFFSLLILIGLIVFMFQAERSKKIFIGFSILLPYIIFSLTTNKNPRYTLPILIFLILAVGFMLANINNKKLKSALVLGIILFGVIQTSTITFGYPEFNVPNYIYPNANQPRQEDWKVDEVLDIIQTNSVTNNPNVLILYNHGYMNWRTLQYYTFLNQKPFNIIGYEFINIYPQEILNLDFVLYVEEDREVVTEQANQIMRANQIFEMCMSEFEIVDSVMLPNEKELCIYQKKR